MAIGCNLLKRLGLREQAINKVPEDVVLVWLNRCGVVLNFKPIMCEYLRHTKSSNKPYSV